MAKVCTGYSMAKCDKLQSKRRSPIQYTTMISQQTNTPALIKTPPHPCVKIYVSPASGRGQSSVPKWARKNKLEGTRAKSSAQIFHVVNLHSLHFNKSLKMKYNSISGAWLRRSWETQPKLQPFCFLSGFNRQLRQSQDSMGWPPHCLVIG